MNTIITTSASSQTTGCDDVLENTTTEPSYDAMNERMMDACEPLLDERSARLAVKPVDDAYAPVWDLYKLQHAAFWTAEEIDFTKDRHDFERLDENVQHFIKMILAFFAGADTLVNINIKKQFSKITIREIDVAYGFQQMMENVHGEVYADMLINIIQDAKERDRLIQAFKHIPSIIRIDEWAHKWIDTDRRIGFPLIAFAIFEGVIFSGAFAAIYWLKKLLGEDKMKGLIQSNNLIAKDEGMHTNFACTVYGYVKNRLTHSEFVELINDGVSIAKQFTDDAIHIDMVGMNIRLMGQYIEYIADRLAVCLGYSKIYGTPLPEQFQFMETIGFLNKDNFFERRPTEYQKSYHSENKSDWEFCLLANY